MRAARLALAAGLAACAALAAAQQPAPQQKAAPQKATPQQQLERQQKLTPQQQLEQQQKARVYYDTYEASRNFPGRRSGCSKGEDPLGAFCVKACKKGYVEIDDRKASTRQCRSAKPLPPGVTPVAGQKEKSTVPIPVPKEPAKPAAGV